MQNKSDEQLMLLIKNGNERAYGILVKRYLSKALIYAETLVGTSADDILQDAFISVWKNAYSYKEEKALFKTWFYTIVNNLCYNYLKKVKASKVDNVENFEEIIGSTEKTAENLLIEAQSNDELKVSIQTLNQREQQVIKLRYFDELSQKETAQIMNSSVKAIETLLIRAKKKLRIYLK